MKRLLALALALAACAAIAVPALAATRTVTLRDNAFTPKSLTVARGTKVTWVWRGRSPHNVTVVSGPQRFRSGNRARGRFSRTLSRRGTYRIVCTIHPGMSETIRVR